MKRRLCRALVALTMILILFCISACGGTTDAEETFPETEEELVEESEETESEIESEEEDVAETKTEIEATETSAETTTTAPSASAKEETIAPTSTPAPVHTHNYNGTVTKEANCVSNGTKVYTCSCGDSYTESIAANGNHNWKEIYGTVEHPSMGEMRQVQVGTSGDVYICNACGAEFGSAAEQTNHIAALVGIDNDHVRNGGTTIRSGEPVYENQWIVTQEAWSETTVTGYQCTVCGATK